MEVQSDFSCLFCQCPKPKGKFRAGSAEDKGYIIVRVILLILFTTCAFLGLRAQKADSVRVGTVDGLIRDSAHNYVLQSASLAIYVEKDSSLVSYQLSDNYGKFHFERIPVGIPLVIKGFYIGYKPVARRFTVSPKAKTIDLKELSLERAEEELQEVVVRGLPPVRMNGDTLEFNADAFKLDKNAVGEDLLRKLPGVTVWGDGTITVYGKQVSQVLVDGKPFFGGDTKIATQNIPKDAIDKIQIYQQHPNRMNLRDSITEVNIKLKKNKRFGYFGKVAAGYGTEQRYESDANINFFNPRTQLGIVGASNNINKIAGDASTLMRNSTFKGVGASVEYQPDFTTQGSNHPTEAGLIFQHDFLDNPTYYDKNRLSGNYFLKRNTSDVLGNTQSITSLGGDSNRIQVSDNVSRSSGTGQNLNVRYDRFNGYNSIYAGAAMGLNSSNSQSTSRSSSSSGGQLQSTSDADNSSHGDSKNITLEAEYAHRRAFTDVNGSGAPWDIKYTLNAGNDNSERWNRTVFTSFGDPSQDRVFDRKYTNSEHSVRHSLWLNGDLSRLIFGQKRITTPVTIQLKNSFSLGSYNGHTEVTDKDSVTKTYTANGYLTNRRHGISLNEMPAIVLDKRYSKELDNRYSKVWDINLNIQEQYYYQKRVSDHVFQNITTNNNRFVPSAGISYSNNQFGYFTDIYWLNFSMSSDYPSIDQLAPIVDSSNQYYIQEGNRGLRPTEKKELGFTMQHTSSRAKNPFNYLVSVTAGTVGSIWTDSSHIDSLGRTIHYTVNANGNRYLNFSTQVNKAFKRGDNQVQLNFSPALSFSRVPNNINGQWNYSNTVSSNNSVNLYYTYKDKVAINLREGYNFYRSKQSGLGEEFRNQVEATAFSASVNCTRRLTLSSNITYNHSTSTGSAATNYTIWNAGAAYRLMKGNNLELKMAALDLLHQNTSIVNYGSNNTLVHGTANVLQQYFMITIAYFPRRFGKEENE